MILTSIVSSGSTEDLPYAKVLIPMVVSSAIVLPKPVIPKNWVKFLEV